MQTFYFMDGGKIQAATLNISEQTQLMEKGVVLYTTKKEAKKGAKRA